MNTIGVVGLGVVGGTAEAAFRAAGVETRGYDRYRGIGTAADLAPCAVVFLCVPTPSGPDGGHDLTEVAFAVREIEPHLEPGTVIAIKSTIPPGTCDDLAARHPQLEFASVPEFLVASRAVESFVRPDRIVIGARSPETAATLAGLMKTIAPEAPVVVLEPSGGGVGQALLERDARGQGLDGQRALRCVRAVRCGVVRRAGGRGTGSADRSGTPHRDRGARVRWRVSAEGPRRSRRRVTGSRVTSRPFWTRSPRSTGGSGRRIDAQPASALVVCAAPMGDARR